MVATNSDVRVSVDLLDKAMRSEDIPADRKDRSFLTGAVERYRKFLLLAALYPDESITPTRDIDMMWHLHILSPRAYRDDCAEMFGDILDHDGGFGGTEAESVELRRVFERTAALWHCAFGESYIGEPAMGMVRCTRNCVSRCQRRCKT